MIHLIGYGNPGRCDDGLGQAFAMRIAGRELSGVTVSTDYQLSVDHALLVAQAEQVVFVDALMHSDAPFRFASVVPATAHDLTSHSLSPAAVLALSATLFDASPEAFVLGIAGTEFGEVKEGLSLLATENLNLAEAFFLDWQANPGLEAKTSGCAHA